MKTTLKKYHVFLLGLGLLLVGNLLQAQATVTKVCKGETICNVVSGYRGFMHWEQSSNGQNWQLVPFMSMDTFCLQVDSSGFYRAAIQEGTCATIYSEVREIQMIEVVANAGADATFCGPDSQTIGGNPAASGGDGPYSYQWLPITDLNNSSISNPVASSMTTTTYTLNVMDANGCVGSDVVTISVSPAVAADAGPDLNVCFGSTATMGGSPSGSGGTGILNYAWTPATALSSANVANPIVTPGTGPITYTLLVTDSAGCTATDDVVVDTANGIVHGSMTFAYTGASQIFVVPACVDSITFDVFGAQGGANWVNNVNFGGRVTAKIAVTTGETLYVYVGQQPTSGVLPGWNGGGSGDGGGKGGGGASDVRRVGNTLNDRIVVAGGGGGAGYWTSTHVVGGPGGGLIGGDGYRDPSYSSNPGGAGATQTGGGPFGTCVNFNVTTMAGSFGQGGTPLGFGCGCEGYGGGGGWYGGAGSGNCRGGGGGSSYAVPTATAVVHVQGARAGNGQVVLTW